MDASKARPSGRCGRWAAWTLAAALCALSAMAQAAERVALVIGNGTYEKAPILANPGNDARAVGNAFERLGYSVTRLEDAGRETLIRGLQDFKRAAGASDVAVVFYAGHGIEVDTRNFLIPVDATLARDDDVEYEAVPLNLVMRSVEGARRLGLVVLDACRDNPFAARMQTAGGTRSIGRGLARVAPSGGTLVAYASEEGKTADDGDGRNSPYTGALLAYLEEPGLDVGLLFRKVRAEVLRTTGGSQKPFEYGALPPEHIYLSSAAPPSEATATPTAGGTPAPSPSGDAARAYEAAERVGTVAAFRAFIRRFPGSFEAELAQAQIEKLEKVPPAVAGGDATEEPPAVAASSPEAVEQGLKLSIEKRRLVQMGLAAAGHSPGPVDGMLGGRTRRALQAWQASKELEGTGFLTREQSEALVALGRREAERLRLAAEAERQRAREAEERRRAEEEARRRRARKPGDTFRDCPECPEMVVVPSGRFRLGSTSVTIARPFAAGVYEVTFEEWDACVSDGGCGRYRPNDSGWGRGRRPVMNVSWNDAKAYVRWLSGRTGEAYRLLSEAEWEYVARAGTTTKYWWGNDIGRNRANCYRDRCGDSYRYTAPVGSFSANPFGLHDVHGNVDEWVEGCWEGGCGRRVLRGGSWGSGPRNLRSANRGWNTSVNRNSFLGFRVARTLTP